MVMRNYQHFIKFPQLKTEFGRERFYYLAGKEFNDLLLIARKMQSRFLFKRYLETYFTTRNYSMSGLDYMAFVIIFRSFIINYFMSRFQDHNDNSMHCTDRFIVKHSLFSIIVIFSFFGFSVFLIVN